MLTTIKASFSNLLPTRNWTSSNSDVTSFPADSWGKWNATKRPVCQPGLISNAATDLITSALKQLSLTWEINTHICSIEEHGMLELQLTRSHATLPGWKHSIQNPTEAKRQYFNLLKKHCWLNLFFNLATLILGNPPIDSRLSILFVCCFIFSCFSCCRVSDVISQKDIVQSRFSKARLSFWKLAQQTLLVLVRDNWYHKCGYQQPTLSDLDSVRVHI